MKKPTKSLLALGLAMLMLAGALGCQLVSVNEEKDLAQVVAKVGDYEISKEEYLSQLDYMLYMYQSFGMDLTSSPDDYEAVKQSVLDETIRYEMQYYQALKYELDKEIPEDVLAELAAQVDEYDAMAYEAAKSAADARIAQDSSLEFDTVMAEEYRTAALNNFGKDMSQPELREYLESVLIKQELSAMMQEHIYEGITITDDEVRAAYDERLESDKTSLTETPSNYKNLQESFERNGGIPPLYAPAGYKRFRDISIQSDEELSAEYEEKLLQMSDLEAEIGALVLQEEDPEKAARIEEIRAEHAKLKEETDAEFEEYTNKVRAKADEAYQKLQDGAAFETVMPEYTGDVDFKADGVFVEKGKLMNTSEDVADWDATLKKAALALTQKGSYTELIELEDGSYHILQYVGDEPTGDRSFADHEAAIREQALSDKQYNEWSALLDSWIQDETIVTRYPEVIADV